MRFFCANPLTMNATLELHFGWNKRSEKKANKRLYTLPFKWVAFFCSAMVCSRRRRRLLGHDSFVSVYLERNETMQRPSNVWCGRHIAFIKLFPKHQLMQMKKRRKERSRYNITSNNVDARGHGLRVPILSCNLQHCVNQPAIGYYHYTLSALTHTNCSLTPTI